MSKCGAYDLDKVLALAPSQINVFAEFLERQQKREFADLLLIVRSAMWAQKGTIRSLVSRLSSKKSPEEMKPGEQRVSGFKITVGKGVKQGG